MLINSPPRGPRPVLQLALGLSFEFPDRITASSKHFLTTCTSDCVHAYACKYDVTGAVYHSHVGDHEASRHFFEAVELPKLLVVLDGVLTTSTCILKGL